MDGCRFYYGRRWQAMALPKRKHTACFDRSSRENRSADGKWRAEGELPIRSESLKLSLCRGVDAVRRWVCLLLASMALLSAEGISHAGGKVRGAFRGGGFHSDGVSAGGFHRGGSSAGVPRARGPHHHHGFHRHRHFHGHSAIIIGAPLFWWQSDYPSPPPVYVQQAPLDYIEQNSGYTYYCADQGYYPNVQHCPNGWMRVVPGEPARE